jgi:hypothetical protein
MSERSPLERRISSDGQDLSAVTPGAGDERSVSRRRLRGGVGFQREAARSGAWPKITDALRYRAKSNGANHPADIRGVGKPAQQVRALVRQSVDHRLHRTISGSSQPLALNGDRAAAQGSMARFAVVADEVRQLADSSAWPLRVTRWSSRSGAADRGDHAGGRPRWVHRVRRRGRGLGTIGTAIAEVQAGATALSQQAENRDVVGELAAWTALVARAAAERLLEEERIGAAEQQSAPTETWPRPAACSMPALDSAS